MIPARWWLGVVAAMVFSPSPVLADAGVTIHRDLPYVFMPRDAASARQESLDLFLPASRGGRKPPLVVFVHGGYWHLSDDRYGIGNALAQALTPHGVAVALVRYPLAPASRFPVQAEQVARAFAYLQSTADQYGYDAKRMFLMGHSAGAHLVSLVALDDRYLRNAGAAANLVAGVIAVSGIYDLGPSGPLADQMTTLVTPVFGNDARKLRDASPVNHVRRGSPFLILSAEKDFAGFQVDARRFAARLRAAGQANVQEIVLQYFDHFTLMDLRAERSLMRDLVLNFIGMKSLDPYTDGLLRARRVWQEPPVSTEPFWADASLVRTYPIDDRFVQAFSRIYALDNVFELKSYPLQTFHAIELTRFLETLPREKVGSGDYLVLTNLRQEKVFWRLSEIEPYQPVIVVGVDDEHNLFRMTAFYHNKREYSWKEEKPSLSARPLGAFIYFLKPAPARINAPTTAMYSLSVDSFKRVENDPLAVMADLPQEVHEVLTFRHACISCHGFRGIDVRAGNIRARDGALQGGFALPLESYPHEAWRQFMFENHKSAAAIGVRMNMVTGPVANTLYQVVTEARERQSSATR